MALCLNPVSPRVSNSRSAPWLWLWHVKYVSTTSLAPEPRHCEGQRHANPMHEPVGRRCRWCGGWLLVDNAEEIRAMEARAQSVAGRDRGGLRLRRPIAKEGIPWL